MATLAQKWSVLVVSEEEGALQRIAGTLTRRGYRVLTVAGGDEAVVLLERDTVHVVLTDLKMRRVGGLDVLREAHALDPDMAVIMMTRYGSIASAVEAMRGGAYDYLTKPVNLHELELVVQRAVAQLEVNAEVRELRRRLDLEYGFENIIGHSLAMRRIYRTIVQVAASAGTILLAGGSGTGKELIARAIHRNSPRQDKPFIALSCAAFSEGLLENELFGHERGAFTGANEQKRGLFELADGGVLFLDEIGEISLTTQVKLLRVLETQELLATVYEELRPEPERRLRQSRRRPVAGSVGRGGGWMGGSVNGRSGRLAFWQRRPCGYEIVQASLRQRPPRRDDDARAHVQHRVHDRSRRVSAALATSSLGATTQAGRDAAGGV